ncbi:MAG: ThuA domain-containing protein [Planctomyces sp.]|nr:ThuA domain-containing protein [Planctomyces sp.]
MPALRFSGLVLSLACLLANGLAAAADEPRPRRIVIVAGVKSHGPEGNRIHDYPWSARLLKTMLETSNVREQVRVSVFRDGWPDDPAALDGADAVMVISDGRDGDLYAEAPHLESPQRVAEVQRLIDRGCGLLTFHFSTFAPDQYERQILDWSGGYFDWEENGERKWHSAIEVHDTEVLPVNPSHPALRGVRPFQLREEFYFNLRFEPAGAEGPPRKTAEPIDVLGGRTTPLAIVPALPGRDAWGQTVAWARERENGGRGFGTTCGHFYDNWQNESFRRLVLNALVWAAGGEVPEQGVEAALPSRRQIAQHLGEPYDRVTAGEPEFEPGAVRESVPEAERIRVLMFAGNDAHRWHNWERTTPAIRDLLQVDPRISVDVSYDIEDLGRRLSDAEGRRAYDVIVQNYVNWQDGTPLSEESRQAFVEFLNGGGGLALVHFSNGAFHPSLPDAGAAAWPEYRRIVRRMWNHDGPESQRSSHDPFRTFTVNIAAEDSPLTAGLQRFEVLDELYFAQQGDEPVEPLLTATSVITRRPEPLAWTYTYGGGRVFQTLLGHSERTYEAFEPREMLRRAVAWCAGREVRRFAVEEDAAFRGVTSTQQLIPGQHGSALNARVAGMFVAADEPLRRPPLTVDARVRIDSPANFNIIAASEPKSSPEHWELYTYAGGGELSVYLPGHGGEYRSQANICDRSWHTVCLQLEPARVRLYVDGRNVLDRQVSPPFETNGERKATRTLLGLGRLVEDGLGCDGAIDELQIRSGIHDPPPADAAFAADANTLALWRFDALQEGGVVADETGVRPAQFDRPQLPAADASMSAAPRRAVNHWGKEMVGFDWQEGDSVDGRWQQTQVGPFLASILPINGEMTEKGLSIKVGDGAQGTVCYDTARGQMRAAWLDGFLQFKPARYGLIEAPVPNGTPVFVSGRHPGFPGSETDGEAHQARFRGLWRNGSRVVLNWQVGETRVLETPGYREAGPLRTITRSFEFGPGGEPIVVELMRSPGDWAQIPEAGPPCVVLRDGEDAIGVAVISGGEAVALETTRDGAVRITADARTADAVVQVATWRCAAAELEAGLAALRDVPAAEPVQRSAIAGDPQWTEEIVTQGTLGAGDGPYVVDTITLPFQNPYRALLFVAGHDFLSEDAALICTVHGDVWLVRGLAGDLSRLTWKRFATGLFQPLGMLVRKRVTPPPAEAGGAVASATSDVDVLILGRDQITRLHDLNGDDEADYYECFHGDIETSAGGHDYVTCLETDAMGRLYYLNANEGLVRVSPDGRRKDVVATGFRNPNGLGVSLDGDMTVAPQEGEWTPASGIFLVREGGYGGYGGPQVKFSRPLGYDPPLCWIPRRQDNSSGGQVWVTSDRWGPLAGKLLHLSYGQCTLQLVLTEFIHGQAQGGTLVLPHVFESGVCRGRFSPYDGQLYLTGLRGWTTAATQDGCFQRVRHTGGPVHLPVNVATLPNGMLLTFSKPLDRDEAEDPDNYFAEQWNIAYREQYGSPEFKVSNPREEGRDKVEILSATLLDDDCTVFLEVEQLAPVSQFNLSWTLRAADGTKLAHTYAHTIHNVRDAPFDPARITRRPRRGQLTAEELEHSRPGVKWTFRPLASSELTREDVRLSRTLTLLQDRIAGEAIPYNAVAHGFLHVPLKGEHRLRLEGSPSGHLRIQGVTINAGQTAVVPLHAGYNRYELTLGTSGAPVSARVLWSSDAFPEEPIPPESLWTTILPGPEADSVQAAAGRRLLAGHNCARCHPGLTPSSAAPERGAPSLVGAGHRLNPDWVRAWVLDPPSHRPDATMPALLQTLPEEQRATAAADLAAWLETLADESTRPGVSSDRAPGDADRGSQLYEDLGCIACHRLNGAADDEWDRIPLGLVAEKFLPGALHDYLRAPLDHFPNSYMPDFRLTDQEAAALTAFLVDRASPSGDSATSVPGDAARGRTLFETLQCRQCHATAPDGELPAPNAPKLHADDWELAARGCLANPDDADPKSPRHPLTHEQRSALREAVLRAGGPPSLADESLALMTSLRCSACHDRDGRRSPRMEIIAEEGDGGLSPEQLPALTWTGDRLKPEWTEAFLAGRVDEKPRAWLKARMPAFPAYARTLALGMAAQHGHDGHEAVEELAADASRLDAGRELLNSTGLDCRQCHGVGRLPPTGDRQTLLAPGINFASVRERMRPEFYHRWMLDPPRYDLNTRMPKLAIDGRTTKVTRIYEGDARRQFDAIWEFLQQPDVEAALQADAAGF